MANQPTNGQACKLNARLALGCMPLRLTEPITAPCFAVLIDLREFWKAYTERALPAGPELRE